MYNIKKEIQASLGHFRMDGYWMRYSEFVPRLYNWCLDLGFDPSKIMPSRAFCIDESQGYPIMLLAKHFGIFPFNHGQAGGIMACDRHGPHAHHGKDLVIVHSSHVGYDPETANFGEFLRSQTDDSVCSSNCGKIHGSLSWYQNEYDFAREHIYVEMRKNRCLITIDNLYLAENREQGLVLLLDKIIEYVGDDEMVPVSVQSTSRTFESTKQFHEHMQWFFKLGEGKQPIGDALLAEYFTFIECDLHHNSDEESQLEKNLIGAMPWIVTSASPMLTAAQTNTQAEFDRAFRSISQSEAYAGKNLLYISGLHVDISPTQDQEFILTKFIPWAAYIQSKDGDRRILEQKELFGKLKEYSPDNPNQLDFDKAISMMEQANPVSLQIPY